MFEYIHNIPGRLRLRARRLKANAVLARELQAELMHIPGVQLADINLLTGSVLILHDGEPATVDEIAARLSLLTQAELRASIRNPSMDILNEKATQTAVNYLVETVLERLVMTSVAMLL